jgi:hypothetical protein
MSDKSPSNYPDRRAFGLVIAAAISWIPLISILIARFMWHGLPGQMTSHWNFAGVADAWTTPQAAFWSFLPPAAVLAVAVTGLVAAVGNDLSRVRAAIGIGLAIWFLSTITGIWFALVLSALHPANASLYITVLLLIGGVFGALAGGAVALPRRVKT